MKQTENLVQERKSDRTESERHREKFRPDEFPYLFPFHLATESASLKLYYKSFYSMPFLAIGVGIFYIIFQWFLCCFFCFDYFGRFLCSLLFLTSNARRKLARNRRREKWNWHDRTKNIRSKSFLLIRKTNLRKLNVKKKRENKLVFVGIHRLTWFHAFNRKKL